MGRDDSIIWMVITPIFKWLKTRKAWFAIAGTFILLVGLAWLFAYQAQAFPAADPYNVIPNGGSPTIPDDAVEETLTVPGYVTEGQSVDERFDLAGERIWTIEVTFTAMDEPPARNFRFTNEADDFTVTVTLPDGTTDDKSDYTAYETNKGAAISFVFDFKDEGGMDWSDEGGNSIMVSVECTEAGNHVPFFSPFSFREIADNGNDYSIEVHYSYTE